MNRGKQICKALKELRKRIADANGIPFEIDECTYDGPCQGTCPKCEQELRQLEASLREKERRGEPLVIDNIVTEDELCRAFDERPMDYDWDEPDDYVVRTPGIVAEFDKKDDEILYGGERAWTSLEGDIAAPPLEGELRFPTCNHNRLLANALMNQLLKTVDNRNMLFSPIGVASILTMLLHATEDKTLISQRIYSLLDGFRIEEFDEYRLDGITLEHGTSMWYDHSLGLIKESYVEEILRIFSSEPHAVDFTDSDAVKTLIDKWASEHTNGIIKQLDLQISRDALMLLIDALYMKAAWEEPFDEDGTRHRTFFNADGSISRVDMMHLRTHNAEYERTEDYQAVNLQYSGCDVFMTIVLPHKGKDLATVMRYRDWLEVDLEDDYDIDLRLPRFRFDFKLELNEILKAIGLGDLFDTETAMPKMTDAPAHISRIFQQSAISVTEQGTEAAAVTAAEIEVGCLPPDEQPKYHRMTVDRPFGFAIQDIYHNVLFMGIVNHLDEVEPIQPVTQTREGKYITSITVAGTSHIKNIEALSENIFVGSELSLKHETDNRYDRNAIGIYLEEERIGYVPRKDNQILANLLDAGIDLYAIVTVADWRGNWFDIQANILLANK